MNTNRNDPLVRLGQGDYARDIYPPTPPRHRDGRLNTTAHWPFGLF